MTGDRRDIVIYARRVGIHLGRSDQAAGRTEHGVRLVPRSAGPYRNTKEQQMIASYDKILANVLLAIEGGQPTKLSIGDDQTTLVEFTNGWVKDGDYPQMTVLEFMQPVAGPERHLLLFTGPLSEFVKYSSVSNSEWNDRKWKYIGDKPFGGGIALHNFSEPGKRLISTELFDAAMTRIRSSEYALKSVIAVSGKTHAQAPLHGAAPVQPREPKNVDQQRILPEHPPAKRAATAKPKDPGVDWDRVLSRHEARKAAERKWWHFWK